MSRRHEQLLFRYSSALERGDFETVAEVLHDAERDPALEQMILDMNAAYSGDSSVNHKNPKEIPMIAALYQRRPPARDQWQSLPLIAALTVIGLLVAMLALQTRSNKDLNTGQGGSPVPAVAQNNSICQGKSRETLSLYSHPSTTSVVVGTLPSETPIRVLDEQLATDGDKWLLWFFAATDSVQGWALSDAIAASNCPQAPTNFTPPIIQPQISVMTLVPSDAAIPPNVIATVLPPTVVPPSNANQSTSACSTPLPGNSKHMTLYSQPSVDATVVSDFYTVDASKSQISVLQATIVADQTWYDVEIDSDSAQSRGWVSAEQFSAVAGNCATLNVQAVALATPIPVPANSDQQAAAANAVTTACPASNAGARITMYSRPSLDSYKFSQSYDAAQYAFFLLDSTDMDGQTWYYVRIDSAVDEKQGWISGDDYSTIKDCAPWNTVAQAVAVPADVPTIVIPSTSFSVAQPTLISADASPSPVPTEAMFILDTCRFDLTKAVALYAEASNDARAIDFLHMGTTVQVSEPSPLWYWVTAYYSDGTVSSTGFVRTDMLTLPDNCHLVPAGNGSVIPATLVPADGVPIPNLSAQAVTSAPLIDMNPAASLYNVYVTQPGDTLYSILLHFRLDMSAMPELMFINNLPQNPVISEGMTLLIPTANNAQPLTCVIGSQKTVELHTQPSTGASVIMSLHAGSVFSVTSQSIQSNGTWYGVTAQINTVVISGVWVTPDTITISADCQRFASAGVVTHSPATVMPPATATPIP